MATGIRQLLLGGLFLGITAIPYVGLYVVATSEDIIASIDRPYEDLCRARKWQYRNNGAFRDGGDRILLDDLPYSDYSKGGVCLVGASCLDLSIREWTLPADE